MGLTHYHRAIGDRMLPPEAIQAFILRKCHQDIVEQLGEDCEVVITVPAYFDESRRHATLNAGQISGLNVIDIVNEPTAAALAYGQALGYLSPSGKARSRMHVLVYDLGGGTFDVTVIRLKGGEFKTLATDGDVRLGGYDWDLRLSNYIKQFVQKKYPDSSTFDEKSDFNLRRQMERVKHQLSEKTGTLAKLNCNGNEIEIEITRKTFEQLTADLLERTAFTTRQTVRAAGLTWSEIDRVLLVGGSTRMPMVDQMLTELSGKTPDSTIHPDESVARGAAIFGLIQQRENNTVEKSCTLRIIDVASHSLGIEGIDEQTLRKENFTLIPKNTPLPAKVRRDFVTKEDNQQNVLVRLLEGESKQPEHCTELGRARINNLPQGLPKGTKVWVDYNFDKSGRLSVEAEIPGVGREAKLELQRVRVLTNTKLQEWKKIVCQDGGYTQFENIESIIDSAVAIPAPIEEEFLEAYHVETQPLASNAISLEPVVQVGAPLAASQALKQTIEINQRKPEVGFAEYHIRSHQKSSTKQIRGLAGHVIFSLLGTAAGIYFVCRLHPDFLGYFPDWMASLIGKP